MPDCNKSRALYCTCITALAFVSFALAATATALPLWGHFINPAAVTETTVVDRGHFGPWQICKESYYGKTKCGEHVSRFQPVAAVKMSGYFIAAGVGLLAAFSVLSVLHLAMVVSREKVVLTYRTTVILKFAVGLVLTLVSIISAGLFSLQTDDKENSYQVSRGESFYMIVLVIILNFILFVAALYDIIFLRRADGDPTATRDPTGNAATTYNNPGYRDRRNQGGGVSMTEASGKPYATTRGTNGSMASMSTTLSSNGSTLPSSLTRSPLRSSLKKPKVSADPSLGIQNPGFSGSSPTFNRNGSIKKVRIQTQSTAV